MDNNTLQQILERLVRIETRLTKLLVHLGLDPYSASPTNSSSTPKEK